MVGGAALATASLIRPREARAAKSMTVVLELEVTILDPHVITATITRTFGLHVFDMLFAMNEKGEIKPQMVEGYDSSPDKLTWTFTLRDGPQVARRQPGHGRGLRGLAQALVGARPAGQDADGRHRSARRRPTPGPSSWC